MGVIVSPAGKHKQAPTGEFIFLSRSAQTAQVQTVEETRRQRLESLVLKYGGQASLVAAISLPEITATKISRIVNANIRHDRGGVPYVMGSSVARAIEQSLGLETGWMDTPPSPAELGGKADPMALAMSLLQAMEPEARYQAVRLLGALAQPPKAEGTTGQA